jgi:hypothetical protein
MPLCLSILYSLYLYFCRHVLGVMGVITIGVIAGLILESITPRRLD